MKIDSLIKLESIWTQQAFYINPPVIVNNDDGFLYVADTELLTDPPDPDWTRVINVIVQVTKHPSSPNHYSVFASAESDSSTTFSTFQFHSTTDTFEMVLNSVPATNPSYSFQSAVVDIATINGNPYLTLEISKGNARVGRRVHTIPYMSAPVVNKL
jgi:hypothetical protein